MNLRVLVQPSRQQDLWVAICLERYIVAQGNTEKEAVRNFALMLAMEIMRGVECGNTTDPLLGIPQAPTKYWDLFGQSSQRCNYHIPKKARNATSVPFPKIEKRLAVGV